MFGMMLLLVGGIVFSVAGALIPREMVQFKEGIETRILMYPDQTVKKMQRRLDERNAGPDAVSENPMAATFSPSS
jgi:hypothetical protein